MAVPLHRILVIVPLATLAVLLVFFAFGLQRDPSRIPTVLLDEPAPAVDLPPIEGYGDGVTNTDFQGQVTILNFFGSWCVPCLYEHPTLLQIQAEGGPPIYGIAWDDADGAGPWLDRHGSPYVSVGDDADGRSALDFGITGAPESFLLDRQGRVRYKHIGVITQNDWRNVFQPLIAQLEAETEG